MELYYSVSYDSKKTKLAKKKTVYLNVNCSRCKCFKKSVFNNIKINHLK